MISHSILLPNGLERGFGCLGSVEQISRAQTNEGGARNHTIGVQNASRPECLCDKLQLFIHILLRDLVQVSADNHLPPPLEPARNKFRKTLPVTTVDLLERYDRYDHIRVGCHSAEERFTIGLEKVRRNQLAKTETSHY